ncbi:hypothetical protein BJ878DRAFT_391314, partial [Calycina marina]
VEDTECAVLKKLSAFLKPLYDATLAEEAPKHTVQSILPTMDFLLERFEDDKLKHTTDKFMSFCCIAGWNKLNKYYKLTKQCPAYVAALGLCPQEKWDYFNKYWEEDW